MKMGNNVNKSANIRYADIQEGAVYAFEKEISQQDVMGFAKLTGDFNPLHIDKEYGEKTQFKKNIVHGMLAGSLFSTLIGMYCPGERSLYLSQTLNFRLPLFYGDTVIIRGTVTKKNDSINLIILKTEILRAGKVVIDGEAKVKVLEV